MTDCPGDEERLTSPVELYEKLTAQGDHVRALKTAKAGKVSIIYFTYERVCSYTIK